MCDKCFHQLGEDEPMMAFKIIDDEDNCRVLKGHESCVQDMMDTLQQIYGMEEERSE
jgi:hypothetical protein